MRTFLWLGLLVVSFIINTPSAAALTISPTKIEVASDPGQTVMGEIELYNEQSDTKTFYTTFENFEPRGETGAPYFVGGGTGLASWLGAQGSVDIAPGDRITMPYSITIPADAAPGGYFAAIFFGNQPGMTETGSAEVSVGGKVGTLVLLRVNGAVSESGGVLDFSTTDFLTAGVPVTFEYRFNNTGGDRVVPRGEVQVKNMFGMDVATINANASEGSVLPNSIRKISVAYGPTLPEPKEGATKLSFFDLAKHQFSNFHLGLYSASLTLSWGETNQTSETVTRFLIIPWQLLTLVGIALVVLHFLFRQYNRFIIARARHN